MTKPQRRRVPHPFRCRLPATTKFHIDSPDSLIGTGFASMALGIMTAFRPMPLLLLKIIYDSPLTNKDQHFFYSYGSYIIYMWLAFIFLVLFAGGLIMTSSKKIKKRAVLAIHPWTLLLLFVDPFFWLSASIYLQVHTMTVSPVYIDNFTKVVIYFSVVYVDIAFFTVLHYVFACYFIVAQLTVIEKFY